MIYLPDYHLFEYKAIVPWPKDPLLFQQDWIDAIDTIESWLNHYCGGHWVNWAYDTDQEQQYWEACIAFRKERDRTLFLLTWS